MLFKQSPCFLILGAQKSATSSLFSYLCQHPNVIPPKVKEINFFNNDYNFEKGRNWYHNNFNKYINPLKQHQTFEATPEYLYMPNVPQRIFEYNPQLKFIIILRNPIERAYSSWNMFKKLYDLETKNPLFWNSYLKNIENNIGNSLFNINYPSFPRAIEMELQLIDNGKQFFEPSFLRRGLYLDQIKRYHKLFSKSQFLILEFASFSKNLLNSLSKITKFLELPNKSWSNLNSTATNKGHYKKSMDEKTYNYLKDYYTKPNFELMEYLGQQFDWND